MRLLNIAKSISLFITTAFALLFISLYITPSKAQAGCYYPPDTYVTCGGPNYCVGPDLVNDVTGCWTDSSGNPYGCTTSPQTHEVNSSSCVTKVDQCNPPGSGDGSGCVTKTCADGSPCASGQHYCVYSSSGNYWGSCTQEVDNCSSQCVGGITPVPTSTPGPGPGPGPTATPTPTPIPPPSCDANQVNMSANPDPQWRGGNVTFNVSGTQGSTNLDDSWSPGVLSSCSGGIGGFWGSKTCTTSLSANGTYNWTHTWYNCAPNNCGVKSSQCSKTISFRVRAPIVGSTCDQNQLNMSFVSNPATLGNNVTLTLSGSQGSTFIGDSFSPTGGGINWGAGCGFPLTWPMSTTCSTVSTGTYTWTHTWRNCLFGWDSSAGTCVGGIGAADPPGSQDPCSKSIVYTIQSAPGTISAINGTVYIDSNANGTWDPGEQALASGTTFQVTDSTGGIPQYPGNGQYSFDTLNAGNHTITLQPVGGYRITSTNPVTTSIPPNKTINFGISPICAAATGAVWLDNNPGAGDTSGVWDADESVFTKPFTVTTTGGTVSYPSTGVYQINNILSSGQSVTLSTINGSSIASSGYKVTRPIPPNPPTINNVSCGSGNNNFGVSPSYKASGTLFIDVNKNGVWDPGEPSYNGSLSCHH